MRDIPKKHSNEVAEEIGTNESKEMSVTCKSAF